MLATLNIVIGLIFVILLFSLLTSTVMEVIAAMLSLRAKHLRYTLENMLGEKLDDFIRHPLFRQLSYATNRRARISLYSLPSAVSKETFTAILRDIMDAGHADELTKKIKGLDEGDLKRMMQFMSRQSDGDPAAFNAQLERWFDEVMARSSDWYKRTLKWWLFGVGLVLAAIFNADTIQIYQNISSNATVQEFLVDMASNYAEKTDTLAGPNLQLSVEASIARMDSALQQIEHIRSPLGLGWTSQQAGQNLPWWLVKLAGLLLTGIAVTFGAPFWFDILKKLLAIRDSGGKTAEGAAATAGTKAPSEQAAVLKTPAEPAAKAEHAVKAEREAPPKHKPESHGKTEPENPGKTGPVG